MPHGTVPACSKHRTGTARHSHCGGSYPSFHPLSWGNEVGFSLSANKANAKPDCSDGGATLFLAGADHGYCEKEKRTRQNNLQSATVSLQVVIGLCKRKETAALKSKPPFQMGVKICLLCDGFFSFAIVRQFTSYFTNCSNSPLSTETSFLMLPALSRTTFKLTPSLTPLSQKV